ncbi:MAG: alkaline phosphatase D [Maribacter sp.]|jgi:alkaline phosphatase D
MRHYIILSIVILFAIVACNNKNKQAQTTDKDLFENEFTSKGENIPSRYDDLSMFSEATPLKVKEDADIIAFGSCNKHDSPQPLWGPLIQTQPDVWIWLGDAIYGDSEDEAVLRKKYAAQNANKGYQKIKAISSVIGTWDDHDYGVNNGTKLYPAKKESKAAFLDFVEVSANHPTRKREGIYQSYILGEGNEKVKVILLDSRTFRDEVARDDKKAYIPNPKAEMLGEAQWKWLAGELKNNDAAITIIANGTQVIHRTHPYEKWGNYPTSRKRLFKMIMTYCPSGAILLSGDRHHAEISKVKLPGLKHELYEFTSSGLTHTRKYPRPEANQFRVGEKVDKLNFGVMCIDWDSNPVKVTLEVRGEMNKLLQSTSFDVIK